MQRLSFATAIESMAHNEKAIAHVVLIAD